MFSGLAEIFSCDVLFSPIPSFLLIFSSCDNFSDFAGIFFAELSVEFFISGVV